MKLSNTGSYIGPMSEDEYLEVVLHIQKAMAIEPFRPLLADTLKLLADWRTLTTENQRLQGLIDKHNNECRECPVIET